MVRLINPDCPVEEDGLLKFWRCSDRSLVVRCEKCSLIWLDPARVDRESAIRLKPFDFLVPGRNCPISSPEAGWATLAEVETAGWLQYVNLDVEESEFCPHAKGGCESVEHQSGMFVFVRCAGGGLLLMCDDCRRLWVDPENLTMDAALDDIPSADRFLAHGLREGLDVARPAIRADVEAAGWTKYLDEESYRWRRLPAPGKPELPASTACPRCRHHAPTGFWRCPDKSLVLRCEGCDWLWSDPTQVKVRTAIEPQYPDFIIPGKGVSPAGAGSGWASRAEIEAAGWSGWLKKA